jgi:hypothetical protein
VGWRGRNGQNCIPTDDEYHFTVMKPIPDPTIGPFLPPPDFQTCSSAVGATFNSSDPETNAVNICKYDIVTWLERILL